jgi:hypothetical protein
MLRLVLCLALLCSCTYTYKRAVAPARQTYPALYTAWGLDLAGSVGSLVALDPLFTYANDHKWNNVKMIAPVSLLFASFFVYGLSAKSGMAPTRRRKVTGEDCVEEWGRTHGSVIVTTPRNRDLLMQPPGMLPCDMSRSSFSEESW